MNCQACQIEIEELELGEPLSQAARAHMTACAPCRAFHDERQSLRRLVGSLGPIAAPPDFEFRLRARLAASAHGGGRHFSLRSFLSSAPAVALAASFVLLVAGVIIYKQIKSSGGTSKTTEVAQGTNSTIGNPDVKPSPEPAPVEPKNRKDDLTVIPAPAPQKPQVLLTAGNKTSVRHQPRQIDNDSIQQPGSVEKSVREARVITPLNNQTMTAGSNQSVELSVRSPMQPVRVSLDNKSGTKRTVTLEPVVFGSQDFTGGNLTRNASPSDVW